MLRSGNNQVTLSGILNAIDGIAAQEGRIIVMTTNYKEKLDAALIRPGRVDMCAHFSMATRTQAKNMFEKFFADEKELAKEFVANWPEDTISMAQLQGFRRSTNLNH